MVDIEFKQTFFEESRELIERIRDQLDGWAACSDQVERMATVWRALHTIKGSAGSVQIMPIRDLAHELENFLLPFKAAPSTVQANEVNYILTAVDMIENMIEAEERGEGAAPASVPTLQAPVAAFGFFDDPVPASTPAPATAPASLPAAAEAPSPKVASTETIRVPLDRIQRNFEIISELFLIRNQLKYLAERLHGDQTTIDSFMHSWETLDNSLRKNISELEQLAVSMRMMPVKSLMRRMEKTVRDYSQNSGKQIRVEVTGEDTEIDKKILDTLAEPLIHLTRNAMDHGIEDAAERTRKGKSVQAVIRFDSRLEGNDVLVTVSDDGSGIDDRKVLESARRKGLNVEGVRTREDALHLIFIPGFSTKDQASDISGRGVGLDAVKTYVESFGGSISLTTEKDRGTRFLLRLPLGMSLISAIIARCNGQTFAIPAAEVMETRKVDPEQIALNGQHSYFKYRGKFIPCFSIADQIFKGSKTENLSSRGQKQRVPVFLVKTLHGLVALFAEEALSNSEIAVKSVPDNAWQSPFVTGVSILPTGEPVFVISLVRLFEKRINLQGQVAGGKKHADAA
ncbi:MAG TPA: ATP-binding protein [Oligoflexus sp.]|uniref:chemotaxis protein CheA n=1 Tax=Oligoflexus sp. TaxID=1971216 RepID=UPI002D80F5B5|nr:ATP-binding protein [Oligoflexus sp.]HET9240076.1 ATP-binding protein [Oligoflexus sp.]